MRPAPVLLERAGVAAVCFVALVSILPAAAELRTLLYVVQAQLAGHAQPIDFLNLYTGAALALGRSAATYQPDVQLAIEQHLTRAEFGLVPFYLPPYVLPLIGWLAYMPYGIAYLVWLAISCACVIVAATWLAPRWGGRWYPVVWLGLAVLYLPAFLGLALGQTAALMLLGFAAIARLMLSDSRATARVAVAGLSWTLKPQLALWLLICLVVQRRRAALLLLATVIGVLSVAAAVPLGANGLAAYAQLAQSKAHQALSADPDVLPGPTLVHVGKQLAGAGLAADGIAVMLIALAVTAFVIIGRGRNSRVLQLAAVPIMAVVTAPYALTYEMTAWLISFWLLWRYTERRRAQRAALLWLAAAMWAAGDVAVVFPFRGGADVAALLGLAGLLGLAWLWANASENGAQVVAATGLG